MLFTISEQKLSLPSCPVSQTLLRRVTFFSCPSHGQQHRDCRVTVGNIFEATPFKEIHTNLPLITTTKCSHVGQESKNTVIKSNHHALFLKVHSHVCQLFLNKTGGIKRIQEHKKVLSFVGEERDQRQRLYGTN